MPGAVIQKMKALPSPAKARAGAPGRGNSMAEIVFCPVCSKCGAVQWEQEVNVELTLFEDQNQGRTIYPAYYELTPRSCINCGEQFLQVKMPTKLPTTCGRNPQESAHVRCREVERCPLKVPTSCCWDCQYCRQCAVSCHYDRDSCTKAQRSL